MGNQHRTVLFLRDEMILEWMLFYVSTTPPF